MKQSIKKIFLTLTLMVGLFTLVACGNGEADKKADTPKKDDQVTATIILQEDSKEITKKEVEVKKDESLYDVMEDNFKLEGKDGFITSIDDHKQDEKAQKYWTYTINDEQVNKGAKDIKLKDKDKVIFNLAAMGE
ncbi:DUF4430 domain-containing protein [Vagococcus humatus]|uniref:Transcobalamin-like C-terminal domain-containing protein n=1 Tax=Vagococcus humatus TaxID=1889241 RepID=A0A429Z5V7_9ENTE|nr:DUF4430 domain-containing protein [Vagococcus humatus]RST89034.1 hypothetical protein C7P63_07010 [Vagococcus humatus]